jgi:hypothetical protein
MAMTRELSKLPPGWSNATKMALTAARVVAQAADRRSLLAPRQKATPAIPRLLSSSFACSSFFLLGV